MKKSLLKLVSVLAIMCGAMSFAAPKLQVGTNAEFKPFEYLEAGKIVGFDIDLINEIGALIGKEINMNNISFDGLLPALQTKKIDLVVAGMTATEERRKSVAFTDTYYLSEQKIMLNEGNTDIKSFDDFKGKTVGVVLGYTGDIAVSKLEGVNVVRYNGTGDAIIALKASKVDALVLDGEPAKEYAAKNKGLVVVDTDVEKEEYAIAIRKEDTQLLADVNKALHTLKANGTYQKLLEKYNLAK